MDFKSFVTQQSAQFKAWADQVREPAKRPKLAAARRKCLCFDFFDLNREFGLMHIRIPSWFSLTIPISVNGHDWLARQMTKRVKPRVKGNWVKMPCCLETDTDKFRCLRRVETMTNQPSEFKSVSAGETERCRGKALAPASERRGEHGPFCRDRPCHERSLLEGSVGNGGRGRRALATGVPAPKDKT